MSYELDQLHWQEFERLVSFYLKAIIGEGVKSFDGSKDKGRDAIFSGMANAFPSEALPWNGNGFFRLSTEQVKLKQQNLLNKNY
jgi:hypothetical protein